MGPNDPAAPAISVQPRNRNLVIREREKAEDSTAMKVWHLVTSDSTMEHNDPKEVVDSRPMEHNDADGRFPCFFRT